MKSKKYVLSDSLNTIVEQASEKEVDFIKNGLEHYSTQYKKVSIKNDPESVAWNFSYHIEELILKASPPKGEKISCTKGCSNCCMLNVDISKEEAILILKHCQEENISIDWKKLNKQKNYNAETFFSLQVEDRKCTFLSEEGTCKIYEMRPINCRKYFSLDDPKKYDLSNGKQKIKRFVCIPAEIVASAIMSTAEFDSLSSMLLKYKEQI